VAQPFVALLAVCNTLQTVKLQALFTNFLISMTNSSLQQRLAANENHAQEEGSSSCKKVNTLVNKG